MTKVRTVDCQYKCLQVLHTIINFDNRILANGVAMEGGPALHLWAPTLIATYLAS